MKKYVFESLKFFCAAILCTILSAFATPSFANCNLIDESQILNANGFSINENGYYNGSFYDWANYVRFSFDNAFKENTQYTLSFNGYVSDNAAVFLFNYTDGTDGSCYIRAKQAKDYTCITEPNKTLSNITTTYGSGVNTVYVKNIQLEEGTTATEYTPYNPLCATCDGTVVNYVSATGTGVQAGTPTPTNPIEPTFYKQGNMILRKVGDIADSYDATTGKITRRVGVKVFDGTEDWGYNSSTHVLALQIRYNNFMITHFTKGGTLASNWGNCYSSNGYLGLSNANDVMTSLDQFKQWLASQYANGTPVTIYYPLETETTEDWPASYCETPIKIATTKYNESAFGPLNTALANAISVVDSVVSNTITQAASIATLQAQKQTRPNDIADDNEKCPAGKKCLLVTDTAGVPHWYEIVERYSLLPDGYTELQYIESTGTQWIDTGWKITQPNIAYDLRYQITDSSNQRIAGCQAPGYSNGAALMGNGWSFSNKNSTSVFSADTNVHSAQFVCSNNECTYTRDAETMSATLGTFVQNDVNFALFGILMGERPSSYAQVKIYHFKIYDNGVLVRDFVPAKRGDVVGMYDTVSRTFFTNAGSGTFIAGDPVAE